MHCILNKHTNKNLAKMFCNLIHLSVSTQMFHICLISSSSKCLKTWQQRLWRVLLNGWRMVIRHQERIAEESSCSVLEPWKCFGMVFEEQSPNLQVSVRYSGLPWPQTIRIMESCGQFQSWECAEKIPIRLPLARWPKFYMYQNILNKCAHIPSACDSGQ